jgi:23S rRNA (uracil1939-C5)-methyltransferase
MQVKIEKLVYGGDGLGHHDGSTVFVPYALPGEVVEVRVVERRKKFIRGRIEQVTQTSPERVAAPCPHFSVCGGCHYQHIPCETQLRYKTEILRETLWRIGRVKWDGPIHAHGSPPFAYRNRAQWKVRPAGTKCAIGYFRAASSALCAVQGCDLLSPQLVRTLEALRGVLEQEALPRSLREVEAFVDAADDALLLNASLVSLDAPPARIADLLRASVPRATTILLHESSRDRFELDGPGFIEYRVGEIPYRVGHLSFFQVNRFLVEDMVNTIVGEASGAAALDLYAGVGLFTIPLAKRFERVVAVESNAAAVRDLKANLDAGGVTAQVVNTETDKFLADCAEAPNLVVLDPPRAGVASEALNRLAELAPARIHYLSCDPATLARDLGTLTGAAAGLALGYEITEVHLFDVFPQTFHIESLVRLARRE